MIDMAIRGLPPFDASDDIWNMAPVWREPYVKTKFYVASMLQPKRICEIGVYSGIAAMCFLAACPKARYIGIDDLSEESSRGIDMVAKTEEKLANLGYFSSILIGDTQKMDALPHGPFDFIHVDADHTSSGTMHDTTLAWNALTEDGAILIDNGHDPHVCGGVFWALSDICSHLPRWKYYDEGVGSILIYKKP